MPPTRKKSSPRASSKAKKALAAPLPLAPPRELPPPKKLSALLLNRELSWLEFNDRVLEEALDGRWPLLERVKFLAISETNLDEFFMIRVAGLRDQLYSESTELADDEKPPNEVLAQIRQRVIRMEETQTRCLVEDLLPKLAQAGIQVVTWQELPPERQESAAAYFSKHVLPVLTPLAVDPGHPFPFLSNLSLNLAIEVRDPSTGETKFARVKMPPAIPRLLSLREILEGKKKVKAEKAEFLLLESLVQANLAELFPGLEIVSSHAFRITRDADIEIQEDEASDLLETIEQEVRRRRFGAVVRLEVAPKTPKRIRRLLMRQLEVVEADVYEVHGPLGAADFMSLYKLDRRDLKDPPFVPAPVLQLANPEKNIFQAIREGDILLHHPYDAFQPVLEMIDKASTDSKTLAIKMTLYRTGADSPLLPALIKAVENGKQVAVLVELKARFDEENNIVWARALERAGVHVVYGVVGLKTHAKIALIVRREKDGIRRYVHLGTGNYNAGTAKIYTDFGLLTARPEFGEDATRFFNSLTGFASKPSFSRLITAPLDLHRTVLSWIERETEHARNGRPSGIRVKLNSLVDSKVIAALYKASGAGVPIDLIVRGVCCLKPGIPGVSEKIRVTSIVGRFLEHSRVFSFENGGQREVWLSSADWMPRNFFRRVETAFPVVDPESARHIHDEVLGTILKDNVRTRLLNADGSYSRLAPSDGSPALDSQAFFLEAARRRTQRVEEFEDPFDLVPAPRRFDDSDEAA
ncbi:MAG: polyphosphate kinase 1 [Thermoanaerobaculia bacterium]|nr:Polyphosphate kinase [Thermoanaerobaculia bacterium]MCK6681768.1 polyphosphate kinase 1 [Thermoanaerobaculia bacterium]